MKSWIIMLWWVASGAALVLYPGILLANVMSLAAKRQPHPPGVGNWLKRMSFRTMLIVTTLFPLLYWMCYRFSRAAFNAGEIQDAFLWMSPCAVVSGGLFWFLFKR